MAGRLAIEGGKPVRTKLFPPWPYFWEDEKEAVQRVLDSGKVNYWTGNRGREFQEKFAEYIGVRYAVVVNSGTSALHVALAAAGVGPGDEVIVPARTFVSTASSVLNQNAIPVFADVDLKTGNISVESIEDLITERTKAIIPVHLAGHPAEMDPIMELAEKYSLVVIEDAAQAHGAEYKGRMIGSIGHIAAFSFCQDKIITTGGEGGMVVTDDPYMAGIAWSFKDIGRPAETEYPSIKDRYHTFPRIGFNYRMTEMQAAIGLKALEKLDSHVERRRENAHYLTSNLKDLDVLSTAYEAPYVKHSFYCYYCVLNLDGLAVDLGGFIDAVSAEGVRIGRGAVSENYLHGVFQDKAGHGGTSCPFTCQLYKGKVDYTNVVCSNARELGRRAFRLEVYPTIRQDDLDDVIAAIRKVAEAYAK